MYFSTLITLSCKQVKRASNQILAAVDKKKKRPKKAAGKSSVDEDQQSVGSRPK